MRIKKILAIMLSILILSFFSYKVVSATNDNNKIKIKSAKIKSILTGSENFDSNDEAGNDSSINNRIVRSFDTITYNFSFFMADKEGSNDYSDKIVNIDVELTNEEAKYVSFDINSLPNENKHTYTFEGINTYNEFEKSITLYILGAPNGTEINPKFVIKESTDLDGGVYLGKVSSEENYYAVDDNNYTAQSEFENYMPTIVSSKKANLKIESLSASGNGKTNYEGKTGRFITVVSGLYIEGNNDKGIMGLDMPINDINFNMTFSQNTSTPLIMKKEWARFYSNNENDIDPILVNMPYSVISDENQYVKSPGNFDVIVDNNTYKTTISDYNIAYKFPTLTSTKQEINNKYYIGTYAYTVFSPRTNEDGKNTINVNYELVPHVEGYQIEGNVGSISNEYYSLGDYSFDSGFYIDDDKKLNIDDNIESLSKGTDLTYKTTFDYKASFNTGLKEVIKINPYAFKLLNNDSVNIELLCNNKPCENIKNTDFEIGYISGDFSKSNYSINDNYTKIDDDNNISSNACQNINIEGLSSDQVMNLYGGPCLKPNAEKEKSYLSISESETPITKIVVQTKSNVTLPNDIIINIKIKLRIKNVSDLTRLYQVSSVVSTSDYDNKINYYYPSLNDVINPNNYILPIIEGQNVTSVNKTLYADSVRIVNYTSTQKIKVLNKTNEKEKINYNVSDNEIITYDIEPIITDNSEKVGSDDTYIIKYIKLNVVLPSELVYIPDEEIDRYLVNAKSESGSTILEYILPFTKPNIKNDHINFKAKLNSKIKGKSIPVTINSDIFALNINDEVDNSLFKQTSGNYTIYANGNLNVIAEQKLGTSSNLVEKNEEFSYLLTAYNNTDNIIDNYSIIDILPTNNDSNGSEFSGDYKVKLNVPSSLGNVKIYCSTKKYNELSKELYNSNDGFEECNDILENYKNITAFKITDISINPNSYIDDIRLIIKPNENNPSDKYINSFIGGTSNSDINNSNIINISVINRSISGKVFYDVNENGIQDSDDKYVSNVPITLYKIDGDNEIKISEEITNKDGKYIFKNLDVGKYYIDLNYDGSRYDLTYRYASSFENIDSDAYKVSDTIARISNKKIIDDPFGINLSKENISLGNYDMGLISKYSFGFDIKKYITKIDLTYSGNTTTNYYNNETRVLLDVRNSLLATAKIYYGIAITNNSLRSGYATQIEENIPKGLIFNPDEPENKNWVLLDGKAYNDSLDKTLIKPGETKYLQIVLYMPKKEEATNFINTVSIIKISEYKQDSTKDDDYVNPNKYEIGESVNYAGMSWHVIDAIDEEDGSQKVTLFADSGSINEKLSHTNDSNDLYKWGVSNINNYLNSNSMNSSLDYSVLYDTLVCNDSSGMQVASYGGSVQGICQSYEFIKSKVRLLTIEEYTKIKTSTLSNIDWLTGSEDYWLESADDTRPVYNMYGIITDTNNTSYNKAIYVSNTGIKSDLSSTKKEVRPVITISSNNILFD